MSKGAILDKYLSFMVFATLLLVLFTSTIIFAQTQPALDQSNMPADASSALANTSTPDATKTNTNLGWKCEFNYSPLLFNCGKIQPPEPPKLTANQQAEKEILNYLSGKKTQLDQRENDLQEREKELVALEKRVERKINDLSAVQTSIEEERKKKETIDSANLKTLVSYYDKIASESAAPVFNQMDPQTAIMLLLRMNARKASAILALLDPKIAVNLTEKIAAIKENRDQYLASDYKTTPPTQ